MRIEAGPAVGMENNSSENGSWICRIQASGLIPQTELDQEQISFHYDIATDAQEGFMGQQQSVLVIITAARPEAELAVY